MTESSGLVSIDPLSGPGSVGSVGWALPYTKVEVLRLNEVEVWVTRAPQMRLAPSKGITYTVDPQHNNDVIDGGRLNSGDLGYKTPKDHVA